MSEAHDHCIKVHGIDDAKARAKLAMAPKKAEK